MMSLPKERQLDVSAMVKASETLYAMAPNKDIDDLISDDTKVENIRNYMNETVLASGNQLLPGDAGTFAMVTVSGKKVVSDNRDPRDVVIQFLVYCMAKTDQIRDDNLVIRSQFVGRLNDTIRDKTGYDLAWLEKLRNNAGVGFIAPKGVDASGKTIPGYSEPKQQKQKTTAQKKTEQVKAYTAEIPETIDKPISEAPAPISADMTSDADNASMDTPDLPTILIPDSIFDCTEIIPKKYILDGIIEAESIVMVAGKEKIGKTYALEHLALCMASELPWLGKATMKDVHGGVLWVNLDMKRDTARRRTNEISHGLCESLHRPYTPELFQNFQLIHSATFRKQGLDNLTFDGNAERSVDEMERFIKDPKYNIKVCFIDSMIELEGDLDENKAGDIGKFFKRIYQIRDVTGCTFILIHHNTKSGDRGRGSSAIFGATELNLQLSQDINDHSKLILTTDGARDTDENEIGMKKIWMPRLNNDGSEVKDDYGNAVWNFILEPIDARTISTTSTEKNIKKQEASDKRYETAVLKALENEIEGLSKNQIRDKAHIDKQQCGWAVDRLTDDNKLIVLDNGKYKLP